LFVLLPLGAIAVGVLGLAIEPLLLRPLYARGAEEYPLLITFGLLLVLEDVMRFTWGGNPLSASNLVSYLGSVSIFGSLYPLYVLFVIGVGIVTGLLLWVFVYRTKFGIILRATSQDMKMASGLGLDVRRVYVMAFAVGCFLVGLGGAVVVPYQAAVLGMGMDALILAFVVVVVGGLGSLKGAFVGALIVGFVRTFGIQFFPEIELAVLYIIAAAVLLVRPTGLFGRAS
jgi:branched-chain amino acid transport system permease protein